MDRWGMQYGRPDAGSAARARDWGFNMRRPGAASRAAPRTPQGHASRDYYRYASAPGAAAMSSEGLGASTTYNLPDQHLLTLGPVPTPGAAGFGAGTERWLRYQTIDDGYTYPLGKKFSDPYARYVPLGVGLRVLNMRSTLDADAGTAVSLFKSTVDTHHVQLTWPEALVAAGGGAQYSVWCRGSVQ
jgi:hypothetical protein